MIWEDPHYQFIAKLWGEGLSCRKIADSFALHFGVECTVNMIVSARKRAELPTRGSPLGQPQTWRVKPEPEPLPPPPPLAPEPEPEPAGPVRLAELVDGCKWSVGEDDAGRYLFCNARRKNGRPYCEEHDARSSQPSRPSARRKVGALW